MLKAVFIDVGNTLLYEIPSRFEIYAESARRRGIDSTAEAMQALMRRARNELPRQIGGAFRYTDAWFMAYIERIFHDGLGLAKGDVAGVQQELFARFSAPETFALFPGALELLESLRRSGLCLGLISNWSSRLPRLLADIGLAERVDFVLCSAIERAEKPDPALFERAIALARIAPDEALHVGNDPVEDLAGARRAGLRAVLVDHGRTHVDEHPRVDDLHELREWIGRLLR